MTALALIAAFALGAIAGVAALLFAMLLMIGEGDE